MPAARKPSSVLKFGSRSFQRFRMELLRGGFRFAGRVTPAAAAWVAEVLFRTPPRCGRSKAELDTLAQGTFEAIPFGGGRLATWRWGEGPAVFLVHGWGGHAGRLARFAPALQNAGFSVIAFDAPAHGVSGGWQCSLPEFVHAIHSMAQRFGNPAGIVAHSLGAAASILALQEGLSAERAVFLSPPAECEKYSERFGHFLALPAPVREAMKSRLARRYSFRWEDLRMCELAPRMTARLLVFHDRGDTKVPFKDGAAIVRAWPNAELVPTLGYGHHRILRHADVVRRTALFMQGRTSFLPIDRLSAAGS
jgi:pimeloyl-ACP methyl ester carboxylesterase